LVIGLQAYAIILPVNLYNLVIGHSLLFILNVDFYMDIASL